MGKSYEVQVLATNAEGDSRLVRHPAAQSPTPTP